MLYLGLESSCDECAAAVVEDGRKVLSNVVRSQLDRHRKYQGVVPELASRLHSEWVLEVTQSALDQAGLSSSRIDVVAVTSQPGLIGSLLVGLSFAKALAWGLRKPLVAVDHILAHIYAVQLQQPVPYPHLCLLVSGGHTLLALVHDYRRVEVLGSTIDDACGEAFDKVAKHYQLGYPGGPAIDRLAREGDETTYQFPQAKIKPRRGVRPLDVSFSGLKTATILQARQFLCRGREPSLADLAASFQRTAINTLLDRAEQAIVQTGAKRLIIGGGVAANSYLRRRLQQWRLGVEVFLPPLQFCMDNAAMIAGVAHRYAEERRFVDLSAKAYSRSEAFRAQRRTSSAL